MEPYKTICNKNSTIKFFLQDCLSGIKDNIQDNSIDVVVTSPPYNIGINYSTYNDNIPRKKYLLWLKEVGKEIRRVLKNDGSFFLNIGNKPKESMDRLGCIVYFARRFYIAECNTLDKINSHQ